MSLEYDWFTWNQLGPHSVILSAARSLKVLLLQTAMRSFAALRTT